MIPTQTYFKNFSYKFWKYIEYCYKVVHKLANIAISQQSERSSSMFLRYQSLFLRINTQHIIILGPALVGRLC